MINRKMLFVIATLILFTVGLWAADISGKWTAQVPGRSGQMRDATFVLKASGENLTGNNDAMLQCTHLCPCPR